MTVAVVEAGGFYEVENGNFSVVPALANSQAFLSTEPDFPRQPLMDWGLLSEPVAQAAERTIHYPQAKTLGGSSAINTMAFHRGTIGTYEWWSRLVGDASFQWGSLLKYFRKSVGLQPLRNWERPVNDTISYDPSAFDPHGGPLQASWGPFVESFPSWASNAFSLAGLPKNPLNLNNGVLSGGCGWAPASVDAKTATRSSSESSFLRSALGRTNLQVYTHTRAYRLLFNGTVATGALVSTEGIPFQLTVTREVISSAGVFHTPHLLLHSGIGDATVLRSLSIPVVSDLAGVGQNLWDQIFFGITHEINLSTGAQLLASPDTNEAAVSDWRKKATGPLSSSNGFIAFEKLPSYYRRNLSSSALQKLSSFPADWPELEYVAYETYAGGENVGILSASLNAPVSRGNVSIVSSDPLKPPAIHLNWFEEAADRELMVAAFKRVRQFWSLIPKDIAGPELSPGPSVQSDEQILEYLQQSVIPIYHGSGTCAMGTKGDHNAVVDSQGRVFGVQNLRVVDASAFPFAVPGHPQSSVYMLAEKIAGNILEGLGTRG